MRKMEIDIGELNKKIEILKYNDTKDEIGQNVRKGYIEKKVWAKARMTGAAENIKNLKNEAESSMEFTIRYRKGIRKDMKIRYRGEIYNIESVENVEEADKFLIIRGKNVEENDESEGIENIFRYG